MMDKRVQMMDAGMRLFETEKPFGIVLGGIKTEMARYGKVLRRNEIAPDRLPGTTGDCDLFLDRSSIFKTKYISCKLEDAGTVGKAESGEAIHRYAALLKEGDRNTGLNIVLAGAGIVLWGLLGSFISRGNVLSTLLSVIVGGIVACCQLGPSKDARKLAGHLLDTFKEAV